LVDVMLERVREVTREGERTRIQYARFADDLVVLVDGQPRHERLLRQVDGRLREELAKLEVVSFAVDLATGLPWPSRS
jgi:RNA-directed DNA polymerase